MTSPATSQLFDNTLWCDLVVPGRLHDETVAADSGAEMRLRAIAFVEDGRIEDSEERQEKGPAFQRMEAKLDLLLALCGRLLAGQEAAPPPLSLRLSARGLVIHLPSQADSPASPRAVSLQVADWLPDPVTLPVTEISRTTDDNGLHLALQFDGLTPNLQEALERHVFRLHRRNVAQQRQTR